jgi:hypothetical protein
MRILYCGSQLGGVGARIILRQASLMFITTTVLNILDQVTELNRTAPFIPAKLVQLGWLDVPAIEAKHARPRFVTRHNFAFG